jgi:hypothetical protein
MTPSVRCRAHHYLRDLLAAVGVLPAYEARIERMLPWLEEKLAQLPTEHADLVRRFAHWQVLRHLRSVAGKGRLTKAITDRAREQISASTRLLAFLEDQGVDASTATQAHLELYQARQRNTLSSEYGFITWLRTSRINTGLRVTSTSYGSPTVTVSDQQRWRLVERLLHDHTLLSHVRIGGLFTLLFAQPLSRIVAMRTSQVTIAEDGRVDVVFNNLAIQMPAIVDQLISDHVQQRGHSLYAARDNGWLFPGGKPGRHLETESMRRHLVAIGIKPFEARKAALFQLAGDMPAPVLAELLGITDQNAFNWARLAARDWTGYIADRAR